MATEIRDGVYDITVRSLPNGKRNRVFLFTNDTPTLVDTGYEETVDAVFDGIDSVGIEPERLIITHGDRDHIGGFDRIVEAYEVDSWVPAQTKLRTKHPPTERYRDGSQIGQFDCIHTPGHEPDNYAFVDESAGVVVTGDALSGADRRGMPAGYFTLPPSSKNLNLALDSVEKLLEYDFESALVFHGSSVMEHAREKLEKYLNPI